LVVDDQGPGFPPDLLSEVGRRFLKIGEESKPGCVGLGLAIASGIAQIHGGTLVLKNLAPTGLRAQLSIGG
jgi:K+-sensing histidine kinase KdpD